MSKSAAISRVLLLLATLLAAGCATGRSASLVAVPLQEDATVGLTSAGAGPEELRGAGGEWLDLTLAVTGDAVSLRVLPLTNAADSRPLDVRLYRVADVAADLNHAGYLRLHGGDGRLTTLPRALLPLSRDGDRWTLPTGTENVWIDLRLPPGLPRGDWRTAAQALDAGGGVLASLPIRVQSHGFDLPDRPRLAVAGAMSWERLRASWPDAFATASPLLVARDDPASRAAVRRLDALVALARDHRLTATVPDVAPVVKWPAGRPPELEWGAYDALVRPWLDGRGFAGWPLPRMEKLDRYSEAARLEYWRAALSHLDGTGVLDRGVVRVDPAEGRPDAGLTPAQRLRLSADAGRIASAYGTGRIAVPLEADEVRFTGPDNPGLYPPDQAGRLMIRGEGLVTDRATRPWPAGLPDPERHLDLDAPTPAPVAGPGATGADVRLWGWLAFLRGATFLDVGDALPASADPRLPIDPTRIVWFYPGDAFGMSGPVPTVQLKWLRRLEQDYEYLQLAAERNEEPYARVIARTLVRPVRVEPGQGVDPLLPLMAGTPQEGAWREGLGLVADKIAIADRRVRGYLPARFVVDHTNRTTAWLFPRERPAAVVTATRWDLDTEAAGGEERLFLRAGVSVYNPSDARPEGVTLGFAALPGGDNPAANGLWKTPGATKLPPVATYEVGRFTLNASAAVGDLAGQFLLGGQVPMRVSVRDEAGGGVSTAEAVAPAAALDERGEPPQVDGLLGEWSGNEAIINGPMVRMHDRASLQSGQAMRGDEAAQAFVAWTEEGLHVAFKLAGVPNGGGATRQARNFVDTEFGRVWGEDACEVLIQPVWVRAGDPTAGPLLLVVCKPEGAFARRRGDRRRQAQPWQNFESGLRYAATTDAEGVWRAEVMLPWEALRAGGPDVPRVPSLLRFNLSHHDGESGRSTSWAGPVDSGSDDAFTGAIVLRKPL